MSTRPAHISALTGVRILGAIWVVLFHYHLTLDRLVPTVAGWDVVHTFVPLMRRGYLGVDLFFALSGFVMAHNYADRMRTWDTGASRRFLRNRVARVWPTHVVALHADIVLALMAGTLGTMTDGVRRTPTAYVETLTMTHQWFSDRPTFYAPAWAISAEWLAYLLTPLLFLGLWRLRGRGVPLALALTLYAVMVAIFLMWSLPNGNVSHTGLLRIGVEFLAGALLQRVHAAGLGWWPRLTPWLALAILVAAYLLPRDWHRLDYALAPALGLLVPLLAGHTGWLSRWLSTPAMVKGGELSMGVYLTHLLPAEHAKRWTTWALQSGDLARWAVTAGLVTLIAVLSWALYRFVEVPANGRLRAAR